MNKVLDKHLIAPPHDGPVRIAILDSGIDPGHSDLAELALRDSVAILESKGQIEGHRPLQR